MYLAISIVVFKLQKQPFNLVLDSFFLIYLMAKTNFSSTKKKKKRFGIKLLDITTHLLC